MTKKQLVLLALMMLCPLVVMLGFFALLSLEVQRANDIILNSIDKRVNTIVLATLEKVKEDISLVLPPSVTAPSDKVEDKDKKINLEGDITLSTLDDSSFFVNNRLYEIGDVIAPYGIVTAIGRDMVVFRGFDGQVTVFGQTFEKSLNDDTQVSDAPTTSPSAI